MMSRKRLRINYNALSDEVTNAILEIVKIKINSSRGIAISVYILKLTFYLLKLIQNMQHMMISQVNSKRQP